MFAVHMLNKKQSSSYHTLQNTISGDVTNISNVVNCSEYHELNEVKQLLKQQKNQKNLHWRYIINITNILHMICIKNMNITFGNMYLKNEIFRNSGKL